MWNRRKKMLDSLAGDIREHIARETQDNIDRGMSAEEARYAAIRKFGNRDARRRGHAGGLDHGLAREFSAGRTPRRSSPLAQ